ncbi:MAG: hypothetical protein ACRBCT_01210 [Alphaproteobacteria bacterium]
MMTKKILQQLAIERCRMHASHILAVCHMREDGGGVCDMIESLNKDFNLIEDLIEPD